MSKLNQTQNKYKSECNNNNNYHNLSINNNFETNEGEKRNSILNFIDKDYSFHGENPFNNKKNNNNNNFNSDSCFIHKNIFNFDEISESKINKFSGLNNGYSPHMTPNIDNSKEGQNKSDFDDKIYKSTKAGINNFKDNISDLSPIPRVSSKAKIYDEKINILYPINEENKINIQIETSDRSNENNDNNIINKKARENIKKIGKDPILVGAGAKIDNNSNPSKLKQENKISSEVANDFNSIITNQINNQVLENSKDKNLIDYNFSKARKNNILNTNKIKNIENRKNSSDSLQDKLQEFKEGIAINSPIKSNKEETIDILNNSYKTFYSEQMKFSKVSRQNKLSFASTFIIQEENKTEINNNNNYNKNSQETIDLDNKGIKSDFPVNISKKSLEEFLKEKNQHLNNNFNLYNKNGTKINAANKITNNSSTTDNVNLKSQKNARNEPLQSINSKFNKTNENFSNANLNSTNKLKILSVKELNQPKKTKLKQTFNNFNTNNKFKEPKKKDSKLKKSNSLKQISASDHLKYKFSIANNANATNPLTLKKDNVNNNMAIYNNNLNPKNQLLSKNHENFTKARNKSKKVFNSINKITTETGINNNNPMKNPDFSTNNNSNINKNPVPQKFSNAKNKNNYINSDSSISMCDEVSQENDSIKDHRVLDFNRKLNKFSENKTKILMKNNTLDLNSLILNSDILDNIKNNNIHKRNFSEVNDVSTGKTLAIINGINMNLNTHLNFVDEKENPLLNSMSNHPVSNANLLGLIHQDNKLSKIRELSLGKYMHVFTDVETEKALNTQNSSRRISRFDLNNNICGNNISNQNHTETSSINNYNNNSNRISPELKTFIYGNFQGVFQEENPKVGNNYSGINSNYNNASYSNINVNSTRHQNQNKISIYPSIYYTSNNVNENNTANDKNINMNLADTKNTHPDNHNFLTNDKRIKNIFS